MSNGHPIKELASLTCLGADVEEAPEDVLGTACCDLLEEWHSSRSVLGLCECSPRSKSAVQTSAQRKQDPVANRPSENLQSKTNYYKTSPTHRVMMPLLQTQYENGRQQEQKQNEVPSD